ncbi:cytochrome c [Castellaniella ginsengisoli]|uniref:C-type cytochrome n=1 Tax=Castellaniella ginsengisoli TaxID=546114 RepID=A0AB39CHT6_9BURK
MSVRKQTRAAENADPHELNNPVPRILLGLIAALFAWGIYYIVTSGPDSPPALGDQRDRSLLAGPAASEGQAIDSRQLFTIACQACHQAQGQGLPGVFPPLAGSEWVQGDPETLAKIVLHGVSGPMTVLGTTYNGEMPAFGHQFNDAELAALLTFIRSEWNNTQAPVDASVVAATRKATETQNQPWQGEAELQRNDS